ncbi:MAG TPA: PAS domain S-box protein, partial [Anaerolineales bacterium]|nr:PAS domain S-box protein [Anaerolineales bacterium]
MARRNQAPQQVTDETIELKSRLEETEETLRAIRQYMVDAFVVTRSSGTQVVTLSDADFPYRMMVESMNEGAVTVIPDGTIFYCNPRFSEMAQMDSEKLIGIRFQDLIRSEEQSAFEALFTQAERGARGEFCLQPPHGNCLHVQLSIYRLTADDPGAISIIATDITERMQAEEKIRALASQLTIAEHQERQRISQVLHDDLQQRLFAIKTQLSFLTSDTENNRISPATYEDLRQVQRWLSDAIGITRSLSIDLSPVVLQGEGLHEAILWLTSQMKDQHGLQVQLDAKDNLTILDDQMRLMLFQTIRELLFNIVKHADTSQATITLEQVNERALITISDTGKGFDIGAVMNDPKAAHGLLVVQDRLSLLGCTMDMTSEPGKGTRVVIEAPLSG